MKYKIQKISLFINIKISNFLFLNILAINMEHFEPKIFPITDLEKIMEGKIITKQQAQSMKYNDIKNQKAMILKNFYV